MCLSRVSKELDIFFESTEPWRTVSMIARVATVSVDDYLNIYTNLESTPEKCTNQIIHIMLWYRKALLCYSTLTDQRWAFVSDAWEA